MIQSENKINLKMMIKFKNILNKMKKDICISKMNILAEFNRLHQLDRNNIK